jgi:predicted KAP-like P-loop ATPase
MWPDNESRIDLLRFKYLADVIHAVLADDNMLPTTVGVFGDWGSGKSTLLNLVEKRLTDDPDSLVVKFNGWQFEGYEDAKAALMGTILDEMAGILEGKPTLTAKAKGLLSKLYSRVDGMKLAGKATRAAIPMFFGSPPNITELIHQGTEKLADPEKLTELGKEVSEILKTQQPDTRQVRETVRDFQKDFAALIQEAKFKRVIVMIDDLDRCLPRTLVETLEAIKLFLMVPNTAFLIAADELLVQHSIRKVYGSDRLSDGRGGQRDLGRDYLEKLIQVPIRLPRLSKAENESYLYLLYTQKHLSEDQFTIIVKHVEDFNDSDLNRRPFDLETARRLKTSGKCAISQDLEDELGQVSTLAPILVPTLEGSPRRTKRFLNALNLRLRLSKARQIDLDQKVLAKLMTLEEAQLSNFRLLAELQARQKGLSQELLEAEQQLAAEKTASKSKSGTDKAKSSDVQIWLADSWMRRWLDTPPLLAGVNLQPYFFIAHDRLGLLDEGVSLSPRATQVFSGLLSTNTLAKTQAKKLAVDLTELEQAQTASAITLKALSATGDELKKSINAALDFASVHPSVLPQILQMLTEIPEGGIPFETVPAIEGVFSRHEGLQTPFNDLVDRWASSTNPPLQLAAAKIVKKRDTAK